MPRHANREGSVYFRKSDKKWVASVTLENGKRKVVYAPTQQEAIKKRNALIREREQGKIVTKPNQTVAQYLEYWLGVYKQSIRPRSYERYEQTVRLHVVPIIGKMRLGKLLPQHVQSLYAQKQEEGLSANTVLIHPQYVAPGAQE